MIISWSHEYALDGLCDLLSTSIVSCPVSYSGCKYESAFFDVSHFNIFPLDQTISNRHHYCTAVWLIMFLIHYSAFYPPLLVYNRKLKKGSKMEPIPFMIVLHCLVLHIIHTQFLSSFPGGSLTYDKQNYTAQERKLFSCISLILLCSCLVSPAQYFQSKESNTDHAVILSLYHLGQNCFLTYVIC